MCVCVCVCLCVCIYIFYLLSDLMFVREKEWRKDKKRC